MERKKFLKQNSQNKWQKRGLEDNYFKLPFSQNILPKILRIFAKNVECAHISTEIYLINLRKRMLVSDGYIHVRINQLVLGTLP